MSVAREANRVSVRVAGMDDLAQIDGLLSRSYHILLRPDYPPSVLVTALPLIARANPRLIRTGTYFVAEDEGRIVGAGGWTAGGVGARADVAEIRHFITDHRATRRGVGRALMQTVIDTARAAGRLRLHCQSTRTAVPFYAACGFGDLGPVTVTLRPGIDFFAVEMVRRLDHH